MAATIRIHGQERPIHLAGAGPWLIGRSPQAAIRIDDDPGVSREQAMIYLERGRYVLEPLSPRVPVLLDGRPGSGRTALGDGTEIRFAAQALRLELPGDRTMVAPDLPGRGGHSFRLSGWQAPWRSQWRDGPASAGPAALGSEVPAIILFLLSALALVLPVWELHSRQGVTLLRLLDSGTLGGIAYLLPLAYAAAVAGRVVASLRPYATYLDLLPLAGSVICLIVSKTEAESVVAELASLRRSPVGGLMELFAGFTGGTLEVSLQVGSGFYLLLALALGSAALALHGLLLRTRRQVRR